MMELVTGGSGSGKSAYAEEALCGPASSPDRGQGNETGTQQDGQRYYIATMPSWDKETEKKIAKHRAMRAGKGFCTLEWYTDFEERLERADCPGMEGADIPDRVTEVVCGIPCTVKPETGRETEEEKEGDGGMRIITGGAFQGKRAFAEKLYPGVEWTDGGRCALDEIRTCRAVYGFHEFVKRWIKQGKSWEELASLMLEENRDLILICDEIGCGLVPVDAFEREYRESTGRVMNALTEQAERVDRVVCGIGRRIK